MAIYLDEQTRPLIEKLVKDRQESHPKDFVADRLAKMLVADKERLERIATCQHTPGKYHGLKTCCTKCESCYEPGMGELWELERSH